MIHFLIAFQSTLETLVESLGFKDKFHKVLKINLTWYSLSRFLLSPVTLHSRVIHKSLFHLCEGDGRRQRRNPCCVPGNFPHHPIWNSLSASDTQIQMIKYLIYFYAEKRCYARKQTDTTARKLAVNRWTFQATLFTVLETKVFKQFLL